MTLATSIDAIYEQIAQQIIDAAITGVNGVVLSRELKNGTTHPPYIHIFLDAGPVEDIVVGLGEHWRLRYTLMAVTQPWADADAGQARDIALQAASAIITDRGLNSTANQDTVRLAFDPNHTRELDDDILFGAAVTLETRTILHLT